MSSAMFRVIAPHRLIKAPLWPVGKDQWRAGTLTRALALAALSLACFDARADVLVSSFHTDELLRYDETGSFVGVFATGGGLDGPDTLTFGPDGNLYVTSHLSDSVLRYNGTTGAFIDLFASGGGLDGPTGLLFGPDGNLYVAIHFTHNILRYNGLTGMFMDVFASGGGLDRPQHLAFGPDGNLYVASQFTDAILRYDGTSGAFIDVFASGGGLSGPIAVLFGMDGLLYVGSHFSDAVLRYDAVTGMFVDEFASGGGLDGPEEILFGPDGNFYVTSHLSDEVLRYDGTSGTFIDVFASGGGLDGPVGLVFADLQVVPAPGTRTLLASGVVSFVGWRRCRRAAFWQGCSFLLTVTVALQLTALTASGEEIVVNFDNVVAAPTGTLYPGDTFSSSGVVFASGEIPDSIMVGDTFVFSNADNQILILGNDHSISPPNFAAGSSLNDVLMSFSSPIASLRLTTDDAFEPPDIVRLLAISPTGNPNEFRVDALAEGLDNATTPPENMLSVNLGGMPFSFALFQTTTEAEGFDDLTFSTTAVPEPSSLLLLGLGIAALALRRRVMLLAVALVLGFGRPATADVIAYYRFEEGADGTPASGIDSVLDSSGNSLHGTPFGGPIYRSNVPADPVPLTGAPNALSLDFDGTDDRVAIPDHVLFELTGSLTLDGKLIACRQYSEAQRTMGNAGIFLVWTSVSVSNSSSMVPKPPGKKTAALARSRKCILRFLAEEITVATDEGRTSDCAKQWDDFVVVHPFASDIAADLTEINAPATEPRSLTLEDVFIEHDQAGTGLSKYSSACLTIARPATRMASAIAGREMLP